MPLTTGSVTSEPTGGSGAAATSTSKGAAAGVNVSSAIHVNGWFTLTSAMAVAVTGYFMVFLVDY